MVKKFGIIIDNNPSFTQRTQTEIKHDSRSDPPNLISFFKTFLMKNMSTLASNTWSSSQRFNETNITIIFPALSFQQFPIASIVTILMKTRYTKKLVSGSTTWMPALKYFETDIICNFDTRLRIAHIFQSLNFSAIGIQSIILFKFHFTETTFSR